MHFSNACLHLATLAVFATHIVNASPIDNTQLGLVVDTTTTPKLPNKIRQNDSICDAGSAQWTGTIGIGEGRGLFYWYFESRHEPEHAPLVIWLNGGPGASSLLGAFHEIGPCKAQDGIKGTKKNELSWTNFANMLFIDQPVGVGFSKTNNTNLWADNLLEGGTDFARFLDTFIDELFPELKGRPIHFAGESFGGKFVPVYAAMSHRRFSSIILVDAMVDFPKTITGLYEHLCVHRSAGQAGDVPPKHLNETACAAMEKSYVNCEYAARLCDLSYAESTCSEALMKCTELYSIYMAEVVPGGRNPYDDRLRCIDPPMCGQLGMQAVSDYLNTDKVQGALGFHAPFDFEVVNMDMNAKWSNQTDMFIPSTREIATLLDHKNTPILVLNGNNDVIVNSEGVVRIYNDLLWAGHANFKHQSLQSWFFREPNGETAVGGQFKSAGNLMLVTVDEAGHMSPMDQPIAVAELMQKWLKHGVQTNVHISKSPKNDLSDEL